MMLGAIPEHESITPISNIKAPGITRGMYVTPKFLFVYN